MIYGIIVAGGIGNRMNLSGLPKQFLPIGKDKKPILIHTLEKFLLCEKLDYVYIGVHKDWTSYAEEIINNYKLDVSKIRIVEGGKDRNGTIFNVIKAIAKDNGSNEDDIVVTHDAVRPFLTLRMIEQNIEAAKDVGACDTVIPAVDTIIESAMGDNISSVPIRSNMYQGQTPQSFNMAQLKKLYYELSESEREGLTDACSIFVKRNKPVKLVMGDTFNIKITTVSDYKIAEAILGGVDK